MNRKLKVLLIGSGGRESALAWKLRQSPHLGRLFVAPGGNPYTDRIATPVNIQPTEIEQLRHFAIVEGIDLTIPGGEDPLGCGIVDAFREVRSPKLPIFGPTKDAAQLETSKAFSQGLRRKKNVPTARHKIFTDPNLAKEYLKEHFRQSTSPIVIKASGLALGKGVYIVDTLERAYMTIDMIMVSLVHGESGRTVVIEDFVSGPEISIHALCDGRTCSLFPSVQDHKPVLDGDRGPNTGGMGTISPVPWYEFLSQVNDKIVIPTLRGMEELGHPFSGLLFPGLKISSDGPVVLEYNVRPGDPETQPLMRRLKTDLLEILMACVEGRLDGIRIEWDPRPAACVVLTSGGYPGSYKRGFPIKGISEAEKIPGVVVFPAGTKLVGDTQVTNGGRVLNVTAIGDTLQQALERVYTAVGLIHFRDMHYRKDIGASALAAVTCHHSMPAS